MASAWNASIVVKMDVVVESDQVIEELDARLSRRMPEDLGADHRATPTNERFDRSDDCVVVSLRIDLDEADPMDEIAMLGFKKRWKMSPFDLQWIGVASCLSERSSTKQPPPSGGCRLFVREH